MCTDTECSALEKCSVEEACPGAAHVTRLMSHITRVSQQVVMLMMLFVFVMSQQ